MQAILSDIHFIEDSEDEVFISRLLLKRGKFGGALNTSHQRILIQTGA
jgi:hypothetical protein